MVSELTLFDPYFAEYQTSLDGLTENIFKALDQAVGFISVMHHRGNVIAAERKVIRASVWVEQEIAIAAFLVQALKRKIHAAAFIEEGIHLEGVRKYIIFNPEPFRNTSQILDRLRVILPSWSMVERAVTGTHLVPEFVWPKNNKPKNNTGKRHDYEVAVLVKNDGSKKVREVRVDIWVPKELVTPNAHVGTEFEGSKTHRYFSNTVEMELYPGASIEVARIPYSVDDRILDELYPVLKQPMTVKIYSDEMQPESIEDSIEMHHCF